MSKPEPTLSRARSVQRAPRTETDERRTWRILNRQQNPWATVVAFRPMPADEMGKVELTVEGVPQGVSLPLLTQDRLLLEELIAVLAKARLYAEGSDDV